MRIAFLCKRRYMSKDVILDRYARLYEIPRQLAEYGHEVRAFCLDYYHENTEGTWQHKTEKGSLVWHSKSLGRWKLGLLSYPFYLQGQLKNFQPDVIIAASDIPHVVLGGFLANRLEIPYCIDLYDNFEGFGQAKIPGFVKALRASVKNAGLVITTSELLKQKVINVYRAQGRVVAMPSSVDLQIFCPQNKQTMRQMLGLPKDALLIGTAGGLMRDRGIDVLYEGFLKLNKENPSIHLVLAGPVDKDYPPPAHPAVHYLGMLAHKKTANLFNALDIGVIYLKDTVFGRYCFPQKAYEMMACNLPIVATNLGAMPDLLDDVPHALYQEDNIESLVKAVLWQLEHQQRSAQTVKDWQELMQELERELVISVATSK